jgi:hypothetical protein
MNHIKNTFLSIVILLSCSNLFAQKYIGVDFGLQKINAHSRTYYGDWVMNSEIHKGTPPLQLGFSYLNTKNKFQWQTGLHYRQYFVYSTLTDYQNPNLGTTKIIEKTHGIAQVGIPLLLNYQINNSENIKLRPFVGFDFNKDFCIYCNTHAVMFSKNEKRTDDPIESNLEELPSKFIDLSGRGMKLNLLLGINADFIVGKNNDNVFRVSFINGYNIWGMSKVRWTVNYFGESSNYYTNLFRMNYYSLQFSYLHRLGKNKE